MAPIPDPPVGTGQLHWGLNQFDKNDNCECILFYGKAVLEFLYTLVTLVTW